jgi:Carboxypeptidase regulatory-like domain
MVTSRGGPFGRPKSGMVAAMAVIALAGSAGAIGAAVDGPVDAPLPQVTPAQLAARIREAMARYDDRGTFRIAFTSTLDTNNDLEWNRASTAEKPKAILVSFRGRARFDGDGTRWRVEYDSMMPNYGTSQLWPDRWTSGFDGTRSYRTIPRFALFLGESNPAARRWTPRSVIWDRGDELVRMLEPSSRGRTSIAITQQVIDGVRCYAVESRMEDVPRGGETIISPRQGYLTIRRKWTFHGKTQASRNLLGVHEVAPGIWAPERIEDETTSARDDGATRFLERRRIQVVEYRPGRVPPEADLRPEIPYGVDVIDRASGLSYYKDPWWPEVMAMLREKYGWPPPDFSPLRNLGSYSERRLDGQPAPALRIARWLNSSPIDLASLKGKVVLVEFGDLGSNLEYELTPALRALYAAYHPAGLEVLSIHEPATDTEELRRFARDSRLPYAVVIDEGLPGSSGATAESFAIRGRISAFLIDHEGRVRSMREPDADHDRNIETIIALLKQAGAVDVKPVSLEKPQLADDASKAVDRLFRDEAKRALATEPPGKITGRILDENKKPIAGASVRASLQLMVMSLTSPGSWYRVWYGVPDDGFAARSGADGRFEIGGLCKGGYVVRVERPGRAWVERKVFLAPDLPPRSIDFVLNQGDTIAGQVRDPRGRPIAHARVIPASRQHFEDGEFRYTVDMRHLRTTADEAGRFRLTALQHGLYVLMIQANGFKDRELDPIPAGDENVVVILESSP